MRALHDRATFLLLKHNLLKLLRLHIGGIGWHGVLERMRYLRSELAILSDVLLVDGLILAFIEEALSRSAVEITLTGCHFGSFLHFLGDDHVLWLSVGINECPSWLILSGGNPVGSITICCILSEVDSWNILRVWVSVLSIEGLIVATAWICFNFVTGFKLIISCSLI